MGPVPDPKKSDFFPSTAWPVNTLQANTCPKNACHAPTNSPTSPFFMGDLREGNKDLYPRPNFKLPSKFALNATEIKMIQDWLAASPVTSQNTNANQKLFLDKGAEFEKQALAEKSPQKKIEFFQNALFNYQMAQDRNKSEAVLHFLRQEYLKVGYSVGIVKVDAQLSFFEGQFKEALYQYRLLETFYQNPQVPLSAEERKVALQENNLQISLVLQVMAGRESKNKNYVSAIGFMEEALKRTPSPILMGKVVELYREAKFANLGAIQREIGELERELANFESRPLLANPGLGNTQAPENNFQRPITCLSHHRSTHEYFGKSRTFSTFPNRNFFVSPSLNEADKSALSTWILGKPVQEKTLQDPSQMDWAKAYEALKEAPYAHLVHRSPILSVEEYGEKQQKLAQLRALYPQIKNHLAWVVETGLKQDPHFQDPFKQKMFMAETYLSFGESQGAEKIYSDLLSTLSGPENISKRVIVGNKLASLYLSESAADQWSGFSMRKNGEEALKVLDQAYQDLKTMPAGEEKDFLAIQNRFLKAETFLGKANTPEEVEGAQKILEQILQEHPVGKVRNLASPTDMLLGRVKLRLAQSYLDQGKDKQGLGELYLREIQNSYSQDEYLASNAMMSLGLHLMQNSRAVEGLQILRRAQVTFPGSEVDQAIQGAGKIRHLLDSQGVIKASVQEGDLGEALKVALDRSGEGPGWRKLGFAGAGVVVAIVLAPEITLPALALGAGGGLLTDRAVSTVQHRADILDAYHSGISDVSSGKNLMNLCMLGLDVAMLVTAGAGGTIAKEAVRMGMSRGALYASEGLARVGVTVFEREAIRSLGRGTLFFAEQATEGMTSYTLYRTQRSLFLGEKFEWKAEEALLMTAMCTSFAMASRLGAGNQIALNPKFANGELFPVIQNGQVMGYTNSAGKAVGWATDASIGATGYYALLLGIDRTGGFKDKDGVPRFDDFLIDQFKTLGALHLGGMGLRKISPFSIDKTLMRWRGQSKEWLSQANRNLENSTIDGGGFWGPQWAGAGAYGNTSVSSHSLPQNVFMSHGSDTGAGGGKKPLKLDLETLPAEQKAQIQQWLGERKLEDLSYGQQRDLIEHLFGHLKWGEKDVQALIGPEGMKEFRGYGVELPFGFKSVAQWNSFQRMLLTELLAAGVPIHDPRVKIVLQGSAVRGRDSKQAMPYRWEARPEIEGKFGQASDIDVAIIVDQSLFDQFVQRKIESIKTHRANDPERTDHHLEWNQSIGPDGKVKRSKPAKKLERAITEKRLDPYNLYKELQLGHNRLRDMFAERGIQLSVMLPESKIAPSPEDAMVISAELLVAP